MTLRSSQTPRSGNLASFFLLLIVLHFPSFSQTPGYQFSTQNKKAAKAFNSALQAYEARDKAQAMQWVEAALSEDSLFCEALVLKGDLLSDSPKREEALKYYNKVLRINPMFSNNLWFICGGLELSLGHYAEADADYSTYLQGKNVPDIKKRKALAQIENARFGISAMQHPVPFQPSNLGDSINTPNAEYINALTTDEETIYFTRKDQIVDPTTDHKMVDEDFYSALRFDSVSWHLAKNMGRPFNTVGNEGALNISPDGRFIFFAGCDRPDGFGSCDIFWVKKMGNGWTEAENLGESVNSAYWDSQPSFSSDGKTLYFASKRPGGKGISDIWKTELLADGTWTAPVNLGDSVNTQFEEMTPFIHGDGQTLYFASKGHPGMGGYDLFVSRLKPDGSWSKALNLGYPINTFSDEMALIVNAKGDKAFISSDKFGGKGRQDIYSFPLYPGARPVYSTYFKGIVYDSETKKRLQATFELSNLDGGKLVNRAQSDPVNGEFMLVLPTDRDYGLNVSREGYLFYSDNFSLKGIHTHEKPFIKNIALKPIRIGETVVLRNIFFDTDKFILKPESLTELQKLLSLLKSNPSMKAELGGHTDNQGTAAHNAELSRNRAKAVYDYLVSNGVQPARLSYQGYGADKPVETNETEQGRASNRRTELKITGN